MRKRLYPCDTVTERLSQDLPNVAAELGELIQEQDAVMGQRHLARHRDMTPADQPHIRDGMVGCAKWAGHDQRRAVASKASDTVEARGLDGLSEGHGRQDGCEPPCEHRFARPRRAEQQDIVGRTPAFVSALPEPPRVQVVAVVDLFFVSASS